MLTTPETGKSMSGKSGAPSSRSLLTSLGFHSLALLLLALHPPFWAMIAVMTVAAFFLAIAGAPYLALMADLFPPLQRGRVGGLIGLSAGIGNIAFILLAQSSRVMPSW